MLYTSNDIRADINKIWSGLDYIWLWDNRFLKPPVEEMKTALETSTIPQMNFIDLFWDCDNFALQFLAEYRMNRYLAWKQGQIKKDEMFPKSVGFAFGNMFRGRPILHAANIAVCQEGVYIIDSTPSENRIWKADKKNDNLLFVFM
jgi:hypothetical protein